MPAASLRVGDVVQVRPGDRLPCDGEIVDGRSALDESPVTGESVPVARGPGEPVIAGSINADGVLRVRVTPGFPGAPATGPGGIPRRRRPHEEAEVVREFRNRIAHHEPVFMRDLGAEYARILRVVRWHDRKTAAWMHGAQSVVALLAQKP